LFARRPFASLSLALCTVVVAACGSDQRPTAPTPPATIRSVTIAGPATATVGAPAQFTASAMWSDNSQTDVTAAAQWSTSDTFVATIANGGALTAKSKGTARITGTFQGISSSQNVQVVNSVLHDSLNEGLQNLTGEPSFYTAYAGNEGYDDFISPITTTLDTITFQGIRCGATQTWIYIGLAPSDRDLPDRTNVRQIYWSESSIIQSIDGSVPNGCPGGKTGALVTYRASLRSLGFSVTAGQRTWLRIWGYLPDASWDSLDQWQFRHGKTVNSYAAAYRWSTQSFIRQTRDLAFKLE
jgi:hypothetical protein